MKPLIQITTIPIAYELQVERARYERHEGTADLEITGSQDGAMRIKSQPIKLNLDTYESGDSVLSAALGVGENGKASAVMYQATVSMDGDGQLLLKGKISDNLTKANATHAPVADQSAPIVNSADLTIRYQMDKMNFDMKVANGNFEFVPGDIELSITQHPEVRIEYIGGPIYVPPSSDPNFEPLDVRA